MTIKVISFDLDGTLVNSRFVDLVWMEGMPRLFAERYGLDFRKAKEAVITEYEKVGSDKLEWYDLQYWLDKFNLKSEKKDLLEDYVDQIELYPEVNEVVHSLARSHDLVITSNAAWDFIEVEVKHLDSCFKRIFSATSDFRNVKKSASVYKEVCRHVNVMPAEISHVGDNHSHDYKSAIEAGLNALHLDRKGMRTGPEVVKDLREARDRIRKGL